MFRILALLLGLAILYIEIMGDEAIKFSFVTIGVVFLAYGLGGAKWLVKIDPRYNSKPLEEYKKLKEHQKDTPPQS